MPYARIFVVSLAATLAFAPAAEAKKFRFGGFGRAAGGVKHYGTHNGVHTLTVDELAACLRGEREIDEAEADMARAETKISASQSDLEALDRQISLSEITLDRYSQAAIDKHNGLIADYEAQRVSFNADVDRFNSRVEDFNARIAALNAKCADKSYYEDDMAAARARLAAE